MDTKPKHCPFCGGETGADILDPFICDSSFPNRYTGVVYCDKCGVTMLKVGKTPTEALDRAIKAWNTRVERTCRNVAKERGCWSVEFLCSECDHEAYHYDYKPAVGERCPGCGARVVE